MRFIPFSSLDKNEPPEPFVNALQWNQYFPKLQTPDEYTPSDSFLIDRCFVESNTFFLGDDYIHCEIEPDSTTSDDFDLELGLLEAVQDIARTLAKTPLRRVANEPSIHHPQ